MHDDTIQLVDRHFDQKRGTQSHMPSKPADGSLVQLHQLQALDDTPRHDGHVRRGVDLCRDVIQAVAPRGPPEGNVNEGRRRRNLTIVVVARHQSDRTRGDGIRTIG